MSTITYGSLFAGVGGIDLGLDSAGFKCKFQVEIDNNCQQTLSYHWPDVSKYGDITTVSGHELPPVDIITFGSPCQDLSVAGKRAGLEGERSGLFHEAVRIIKEMRSKTNGQYPKISIWENVTGALSSNGGADFGQVLHEMDEAGACFSEWAVLDAQYFGVPQRRRRVYLISVYDPAIASRCPDKILPVNESSAGNTKKSIKQGQEASGEIANCLRSGGEGGVPSSRGENLVVEVVGSLQARDYKGVGNQYVAENKLVVESKITILDGTRVNDVRIYEDDITPCLTNRMGTGGNTVPMVMDERIISTTGEDESVNDDIIGFSHTQGLDPQASSSSWPTLRAGGAGHAVKIAHNVRRLTPLECERLMGWPDNHTLYRADGKINSDSARYKMCGNGVASPVIKWIADRLKQFL